MVMTLKNFQIFNFNIYVGTYITVSSANNHHKINNLPLLSNSINTTSILHNKQSASTPY